MRIANSPQDLPARRLLPRTGSEGSRATECDRESDCCHVRRDSDVNKLDIRRECDISARTVTS